ncbi:MAG TPA: NAD(P)-dependent alcohol dehydrogenase [Pyrinomonadaceae bacterium]|jgi:NADPH:quinone reductase-like Zn-dependent oxidoreductase
MKVFTTFGDGIDGLKLNELPMPNPGTGEILVKMTAFALNYRDLLVINGIGSWKPLSNRIPISDGAGEVVMIGKGVSRWKVGARVCPIFLPRWLDGELTSEKFVLPLGGAASDGVLAEYVIFNENSVVAVPNHLFDTEAATLPAAGVTAWHAVARRSCVQPGETVLIQGTGGVSIFLLQLVHAIGGLPIVISSNDEKLSRAKDLGAVGAINYKTLPDWDKEVLDLTEGRGVDHVMEIVGGENLNRSLKAVKISGSISFIGLLGGFDGNINTNQFISKNVRIHGIETGSREMLEEMNRFVELHKLKPVIDKTFAFEEICEALKYLESANHFGKIVLKIN